MIFDRLGDYLRLKVSVRQGSQNIADRRNATGAAWDAHLHQARTFICDAMQSAETGKAVILGSGHLFDVPLAELAGYFEHVVLVDVEHPDTVHQAIKAHGNVCLETCDVTGVMKTLPKRARKGDDWPTPSPPAELLRDADFVLSLNLASQLPLWPHAFLMHLKPEDEARIDTYMADIIQNHFDWLLSAPGCVCLISDVARQRWRGGKMTASDDILFGVQFPNCQKQWMWDIMPESSHQGEDDIRHKVCAYLRPPAS